MLLLSPFPKECLHNDFPKAFCPDPGGVKGSLMIPMKGGNRDKAEIARMFWTDGQKFGIEIDMLVEETWYFLGQMRPDGIDVPEGTASHSEGNRHFPGWSEQQTGKTWKNCPSMMDGYATNKPQYCTNVYQTQDLLRILCSFAAT